MNKRILLILSFFIIFLVGCDPIDNTVKETSIEIVSSTIPNEINIGEFDISSIKIKVDFSNGEDKTIGLKKDMLSNEDFGKLSSVGNHTITVKYKELTANFSIIVREKRPTNISISGNKEVEEGKQITLSITVSPNDASNEVTWTSLNPSNASVNQEGIVTGLKAGKVNIKATSRLVPSLEVVYEITVKSTEITDPPFRNLNNYLITIMTLPQLISEYYPFIEGYRYSDKEYKMDAWNEVQNRFNVQMIVTPFPDDIPSFGTNRINWLISKAESKQFPGDIILSYAEWIPRLVDGKALVDVSQYYETYGRNFMAPAIKESATYKGGLYQLPTSTKNKVLLNRGLIYNVNLLNSLQLENPAKLFNEGKWTWSKFQEYVTKAANTVGQDQSVLSGKPADLYFGMANAAGVKLVDTTENKVNLTNPIVVNATNLIKDLYKIPKVWGSNAFEVYNQSFNDGKSIFQVSEYGYIETVGRFPSNLWGEDTKFGYVPFPYPDSMSKAETKATYETGEPIYQILAGKVYPQYISLEDIYWVFTEMMIGTNLRIISNPELIENSFRIDSIRSKLDDEESVKAITYFDDSKLIFDPVIKITPQWNNLVVMIDEVVENGKDYFEELEKNNLMNQFLLKLNELYN